MKKLYFIIVMCWLGAVSQLSAQSAPCSYFANCVNASRGANAIGTSANTAREAWYDVKFYWLDLNISRTNSNVSGNVLIRAKSVVSTIDTFSLELASVLTIDSVKAGVNAGQLQNASVYARTGTDVNINLPFTANLNDMIEVRIYYHGTATASNSGVPTGGGFFTGDSTATNDYHTFSASPPYNSATWWPCKQSLTDKADSSWFFITTDTSGTAVANGVLTNTVPVSDTTKRWEYKSKYPIAFYLVGFAVGKYTKTTAYFHPAERNDSMVVEGYNYSPTRAADILAKFSEKFGLYPFYDEKLALAKVQLGGGMENQTILAMGMSGTVDEHEVTHQWFGDHVTCGSYRDLWLNEGFARWGESLYTELISPNPDSARIKMCTEYEVGNNIYGQGTGTTASANNNNSIYNYASDTNSIGSLYGGTGRAMYYEKPAMMINSLRFEINNDSLFFLGLRNYLSQFAGKNARGNDFIDVMENTTGMDMTGFFNSWYYGYGYPTFGIKWNDKNDTLTLRVTETTSSVNTPLFITSLEVKVRKFRDGIAADTTLRIYVDKNITELAIPLTDSITGFVVDPNQWIANKASAAVKDTNLVIGIEPMEMVSRVYEVFPNPASDYVNIRTNAPIHGMIETEIYNAVGQRVQQAKVYANQPLKLNALPDGIYFLHIDKMYSYKIMVNH